MNEWSFNKRIIVNVRNILTRCYHGDDNLSAWGSTGNKYKRKGGIKIALTTIRGEYYRRWEWNNSKKLSGPEMKNGFSATLSLSPRLNIEIKNDDKTNSY